LNSAKIIKVPQNQRLFNSLDNSDTFNIIVTGKVGVYYPKTAYKRIRSDEKTYA